MDAKTSPLTPLNDPSLLRTDALIGGDWVKGSTRFEVHDPATGQRLADVANLGAAEADAAPGESCAEAFELAARHGDCDDDLNACGASCSPAAAELCDGFDNDCDSQTDEAVCSEPPVGVLGGGESCSGGGVPLGLGALLALFVLGRRRATAWRKS